MHKLHVSMNHDVQLSRALSHDVLPAGWGWLWVHHACRPCACTCACMGLSAPAANPCGQEIPGQGVPPHCHNAQLFQALRGQDWWACAYHASGVWLSWMLRALLGLFDGVCVGEACDGGVHGWGRIEISMSVHFGVLAWGVPWCGPGQDSPASKGLSPESLRRLSCWQMALPSAYMPCLPAAAQCIVSCHAAVCRPKQAEAAHKLEEGGGEDMIELCDSEDDMPSAPTGPSAANGPAHAARPSLVEPPASGSGSKLSAPAPLTVPRAKTPVGSGNGGGCMAGAKIGAATAAPSSSKRGSSSGSGAKNGGHGPEAKRTKPSATAAASFFTPRVAQAGKGGAKVAVPGGGGGGGRIHGAGGAAAADDGHNHAQKLAVLHGLGFSTRDAERALWQCEGDVDRAIEVCLSWAS